MTVDVTVQRSGAAILQTLQDASFDEAEVFAGEYRAALQRAASTSTSPSLNVCSTAGGGSRICD